MTEPDDFGYGDRVYHRGRDEYGTYRGVDQGDPYCATVWVEFDSGDEVMVSWHLIERTEKDHG